MIYRDSVRGVATKRLIARGRLRVGARGIAALLGVTAVALLVAIILIMNNVLPVRGQEPPQPTSEQFPRAVAAVQQRFTGEVEDPLVEIKPDLLVRESNLTGVTVDGVRYYYAILGHQSFDPVSLGTVQPEQVEIIYRSEGVAFPLVIYYIRDQ